MSTGGGGKVLGGRYGPGGTVWEEGVMSGGGGRVPGGPPMDRMTDTCENTTFRQLRCAGGKNNIVRAAVVILKYVF